MSTRPAHVVTKLPIRAPKPYIRRPDMTVALGLQGNNTIIIGADSLFTYGSTDNSGAFGSYGNKIFSRWGSGVSVVITGAGDAHSLRSIAQNIITRIDAADDSVPPDPFDSKDKGSPLSKRVDCAAIMEEELASLADKSGGIPGLSLLVAVRQVGFGADFLRSDGLLVQPARNREVLGIGENSLVEFLLDNLYQTSARNNELVPLCSLVLQMAKRYCPQYCGGQSSVTVLFSNGAIRNINATALAKIENMFDSGIKPKMLELIAAIWQSFIEKSGENPSLPT